jgi:hypothetical protein
MGSKSLENKKIVLMETKNYTIIVSSCDAYADAWEPFFTLFFRYWPDFPFRIILISNGLEFKDARVETYKIEKDLGWSGNLIEVMKNISEDYVIFLQEDYFLKNKVDNKKIFAALKLMAENNAAYFRLYPCPGPDLPFTGNSEVGLISLNAAYRNSTQAAIWDRKIFLSLLKSGETGWDFETKGGIERSKEISRPFLSFKKPVIDYLCTAIVKGKYIRAAVKLCKKEEIKLNFNKIKKQGLLQELKYTIKKWITFFPKI